MSFSTFAAPAAAPAGTVPLFAALAARWTALRTELRAAREERAVAAAVAHLDDRMLADIGLARPQPVPDARLHALLGPAC